jgi:hypothetical protein
MIHVSLDSSVCFRTVTQSKPGCEIDHLMILKEHVDKGDVRLVVPEVVSMELEALRGSLQRDVDAGFADLEKRLTDGKVWNGLWNELAGVKTLLPQFLSDTNKEFVRRAESNYKEVIALLSSERSIKIPFTMQLWFDAKRRLISGKMPASKMRMESDCCIIQSLLNHFANCGDQEPELYFCTLNHEDFALDLSDTKAQPKYFLHPAITDLPPAQYFVDLKGLVQAIKEHPTTKQPPAEQVEKALERERKEQLERLRRRPAQALDADSQDAGYDPAYYQRRQFPWAALYPTPPRQVLVMPQDEVMAFETPLPLLMHGPPPSPPPPQPVVASPLEESAAIETPQTFTTHGPPSDSANEANTGKEGKAKEG